MLATEEAIINTLIATETLTSRDGHKAYALLHDRLRHIEMEILDRKNWDHLIDMRNIV